MPCPHNEITIVQRSQRQSGVAAAAYQSGEKLFCEYDQQVKHYPEKCGIVHNEILLQANAPQEYADRNTLWNAAEAVEPKRWKNNGTPSLQGGGCLPSQDRYRPTSMLSLSGSFVSSSLFPKA